MRRLKRIIDATMDDSGQAAILNFEFVETSSGRVKPEKIEIVRHCVRDVIASSIAVAKAFGDASPEQRPLPDTTLAQAIVLPTEEWATQSLPQGGLVILVRVGSQDIALALPDPRACEALGTQLLAQAKAAKS
jgi:hypothetical protein